MKIKKILAVTVIFIIFALLLSRQSTKIEIENGNIKIKQGGHLIEGIFGKDMNYHLLMKDKGRSINTFSGDAFITVIPYIKAQSLKEKYGDFFSCDNPGANEAMQNMIPTIMVAKDKNIKNKITRALNLMEKYKIPQVKITGEEITPVVQKYYGLTVEDGVGARILYVKEFEIVNENYNNLK